MRAALTIALALLLGAPASAGAQAAGEAEAPLLGRLYRIDPPVRAPENDESTYLLPLFFVDVQEPPGPPGRREYTPETSSLVVHLPIGGGADAELARSVRRARRHFPLGRWYLVTVHSIFEGSMPASVRRSPRRGRAICTRAEEHVWRYLPPHEESELVRVELDLDGADPAELALAFESLCGATGNCTYHLYRVRGGCAEHLGTTEGEPGAGRRSRAGLRDLGSVEHVAPGEWTEHRYRFDGRRYRRAGTRSCREAPGVETTCEPW